MIINIGGYEFRRVVSFVPTFGQMYDVVPMPSGSYGPYMSEAILQGTTFSITVQLSPCTTALLTDIADMRVALCHDMPGGVGDMVVDYGGNQLRWHNCIVSRIEPRLDAMEGTNLTLVDLEVYSADAGPGLGERPAVEEPDDGEDPDAEEPSDSELI